MLTMSHSEPFYGLQLMATHGEGVAVEKPTGARTSSQRLVSIGRPVEGPPSDRGHEGGTWLGAGLWHAQPAGMGGAANQLPAAATPAVRSW